MRLRVSSPLIWCHNHSNIVLGDGLSAILRPCNTWFTFLTNSSNSLIPFPSSWGFKRCIRPNAAALSKLVSQYDIMRFRSGVPLGPSDLAAQPSTQLVISWASSTLVDNTSGLINSAAMCLFSIIKSSDACKEFQKVLPLPSVAYVAHLTRTSVFERSILEIDARNAARHSLHEVASLGNLVTTIDFKCFNL